jgi:Nucleotidyl transferase AbiEii toxin, Type IV TA system
MTRPAGKPVKNHAASIRARLSQYAKDHGYVPQRVWFRYATERLLFRLAQTEGAERYVLKGAMLFATWPEFPTRATLDLDLLGHGDPTPLAVKDLFARVCAVELPADGMAFDADQLVADVIREGQKYEGVRVKLHAFLDGSPLTLQVDVGFGDRVHPPISERQAFPCLLPDLPAPSVFMYPPETVVAEKFEAMLSLGEDNTRLKDFYDLWTMTRVFAFELSTLVEAVRGTLQRRDTPTPKTLPLALLDSFAGRADTVSRWTGFLRRAQPSGAQPSFPELQTDLRRFFGAVIAGLARPETARGLWDKASGAWTDAPSDRATR